MSEQNGMQISTKRQSSSPASKQNDAQASAPQPAANEDQEAWKDFWKVQGQEWRTEPEIDAPIATFTQRFFGR